MQPEVLIPMVLSAITYLTLCAFSTYRHKTPNEVTGARSREQA
jgi:hypothetical protein